MPSIAGLHAHACPSCSVQPRRAPRTRTVRTNRTKRNESHSFIDRCVCWLPLHPPNHPAPLQPRRLSTKSCLRNNSTHTIPPMVYMRISAPNRYILQTYARPADLVFTRGQGARLYDAYGREYLDFYGGIAVNSIGTSNWFVIHITSTATLLETTPALDNAWPPHITSHITYNRSQRCPVA